MKTQKKQTTENYIKEIRRKTKRIFSSEQKIQIVMEALRAEINKLKRKSASAMQICRLEFDRKKNEYFLVFCSGTNY
ncbi:MAG: hypothetical protein ACJAWO_002148 [Halieaceae bacterium]|jgi:hypothetical protein